MEEEHIPPHLREGHVPPHLRPGHRPPHKEHEPTHREIIVKLEKIERLVEEIRR